MLRPQTGPLTVQGVVLAPQQSVHVPGQTEVRVVSPPRGMEVTAHSLKLVVMSCHTGISLCLS